MKTNRLVWFRTDLRLHDNETVVSAVGDLNVDTAFVFIYDERLDLLTPEGYPRISEFRQKFLAESVNDLRNRLRAKGGELICLRGIPGQLISRLCQQLEVSDLYYARGTYPNERRDEFDIDLKLKENGVRIHTFNTQTLICDEDSGDFDIHQTMGFTKYRRFAEKTWPVRPPLPEPSRTRPVTTRETFDLPAWDYSEYLSRPAPSLGIQLRGGETEALARAADYMWTKDCLRNYRDTRNGLIERDDSSKFSPYLAAGCISPRFLFAEVRRYEACRISNGSTLWFLFELLWRDYFHFRARKTEALDESAEPDPKHLKALEFWRLSRTGNDFVDAAMAELRSTGWLSNRMRQVAASYFIHDMKGDWRMGARWYESCLVDYDPCSNTGNWSYIASAGPGQRPHVFDVDEQAQRYDRDGAYRAICS